MIRTFVPGAIVCCWMSSLCAQERSVDEKDLHHVVIEIQRASGDFIKQKKIDWKAVAKEFSAESRNVDHD